MTNAIIRSATAEDTGFMVPLIAESSGGVWPVVWQSEVTSSQSFESVAEAYLLNSENGLCVNNTVIVEHASDPIGLMVTYQESPLSTNSPSPETRSEMDIDLTNALRPYREMRDPQSLFIAEVCLLPVSRGMGIGTQLLDHAKVTAANAGLPRLSLRVFSENTGALKLYQRYGFSIADGRDVIPYPGIEFTGQVYLMKYHLNQTAI